MFVKSWRRRTIESETMRTLEWLQVSPFEWKLYLKNSHFHLHPLLKTFRYSYKDPPQIQTVGVSSLHHGFSYRQHRYFRSISARGDQKQPLLVQPHPYPFLSQRLVKNIYKKLIHITSYVCFSSLYRNRNSSPTMNCTLNTYFSFIFMNRVEIPK